jgi:hypothetical protein
MACSCPSPPVNSLSTKKLEEVETLLRQNAPVLISQKVFERLKAS